jgi:predicted kinase
MPPSKTRTARIYLLCGKTTYARKLEQQGAIRFSLDEWMLRFYEQPMSREQFDQRVRICEDVFFELTEPLVSRGVDAVIDHGFWRRATRDRARRRLAGTGARIELIYFQVPDEVLLDRLRARNASLPEGTFVITEEMFATFSAPFEPPDKVEGATIVTPTTAF